MVRFKIELENDKWLNLKEFIIFCCDHVNQDIVLDVVNEGHCLQHCGVYDVLGKFSFNSVTIRTANALETHPKYHINNSDWDHWLRHTKGFDFDFDYSWDESKIFGCIYGRPSAARLGISSHLFKYHSHMSSITTKFDFADEDSRSLFDINRLFAWDHNAAADFFTVTIPSNQQTYARGEFNWDNPVNYLYKNFMIDIIAEPVCEGKSFYPTEKLSRAVLCRRPFIVMGSKNYLDYLHQIGLHTFAEFWDETYDGFEGALRYKKIVDLIDHLSQVPHQQLIDMYYHAKYYLDHNFELIKNRSYRKLLQVYND